MIYIIIPILIVVACFLAFRSMKDLSFGHELEKAWRAKKIKGVIVFFKDKVTHYK